MDVFLVPVAEDRYELYCEEQDDVEHPSEPPPSGFFRRMRHRFQAMLAEAERDRRREAEDDASPPKGMMARIKARTLRWVAESIAEQRLLWQLRRRTDACLKYPHDLPEAHALEILRRQLGRDFERHRFWLAIDSIGLIASSVLMLLPGPNLVAYYFGFRIVGHYLSVRGARQGLTRLSWRTDPSPPLSCLRAIVSAPPDVRAEEVDRVATALRLEHLASFFQRAAVS
jgi:Mitochondrial K+-H+ exchange-related